MYCPECNNIKATTTIADLQKQLANAKKSLPQLLHDDIEKGEVGRLRTELASLRKERDELNAEKRICGVHKKPIMYCPECNNIKATTTIADLQKQLTEVRKTMQKSDEFRASMVEENEKLRGKVKPYLDGYCSECKAKECRTFDCKIVEKLNKQLEQAKNEKHEMRHQVDFCLDNENPSESLRILMRKWDKEGWTKCEDCHSDLIVVCEKEHNEVVEKAVAEEKETK
jgi:hypothetical protein